jgi:hypothetical protein
MCSRLQSCPVKHSDVLKGTVSENKEYSYFFAYLEVLESVLGCVGGFGPEVLHFGEFLHIKKINLTPKSWKKGVSFVFRQAEKYFENKNLF